jgi:hypothetical protein
MRARRSNVDLERREVMNGKVMAAMAVAVALAMPLAGCGSSAKVSSARLCAYAGGSYSKQPRTCDGPATSGRTAFAMCQGGGGYYDPTSDTCEWGKQ